MWRSRSESKKPPTKVMELKGVLRREGREVRKREKRGRKEGTWGGLNRGGGESNESNAGEQRAECGRE